MSRGAWLARAFSGRQREADHRWEIARSVQVAPAALDGRRHLGVVVARPHATGWFLSARFRRGLHAQHIEQFTTFVRLRVYALLHEGPDDAGWARGETDGEWRAYAVPNSAGCVEGVPEIVPPEWH
jgi:hypothetical protein